MPRIPYNTLHSLRGKMKHCGSNSHTFELRKKGELSSTIFGTFFEPGLIVCYKSKCYHMNPGSARNENVPFATMPPSMRRQTVLAKKRSKRDSDQRKQRRTAVTLLHAGFYIADVVRTTNVSKGTVQRMKCATQSVAK